MRRKIIILVIALTALIVSPILAVYFVYSQPNGRVILALVSGDAYLASDGRHFNIEVANLGETGITLAELTINGSYVYTWTPMEQCLTSGQNATVDILFHWARNTFYKVSITASSTEDTASASILVRTPNFDDSIYLSLATGVATDLQTNFVLGYRIDSKGYDWVEMKFFAFKQYQFEDRPIYVFLDGRYMPQETVASVESFINRSQTFGLNVQTVDWASLSGLTQSKPKSILVIFQPLINSTNEKLYGALPACLIDPTQDGHVRDDSKYERSSVYDWERDQGLIFVTVGGRASLPNVDILYQNGTSQSNLDKKDWPDASLFFTDSNDIFVNAGSGGPGMYVGSKIGNTFDLHIWFGEWGFWKDRLEELNISFYDYSSWVLHPADNNQMNLSMPCFIKVGYGGWLSLDDYYAPLDPEIVGHDLTNILFHSVWDGLWLSSGWNYDSVTAFQPLNGGQVSINGTARFSSGGAFEDVHDLLAIITSYNSEKDSYSYDRKVIHLQP